MSRLGFQWKCAPGPGLPCVRLSPLALRVGEEDQSWLEWGVSFTRASQALAEGSESSPVTTAVLGCASQVPVPLRPAGSTRKLFSTVCCERLTQLQELEFTDVWGLLTPVSLEFSPSCPH